MSEFHGNNDEEHDEKHEPRRQEEDDERNDGRNVSEHDSRGHEGDDVRNNAQNDGAMLFQDEHRTAKENDDYVQNDAGQNRKEVLVQTANIKPSRFPARALSDESR